MNNNFLTIEEKRAWLAHIFRDTSGEYTDADKLKALEADNRLVMLQSPNSKANLDTSERGTLVPPHPTNGIKNTEMNDNSTENAKSTNQPTVDNSKTCYTCRYCIHRGGGFGICEIMPTINCLVTKDHTCDEYKPY